MRIKCHRHNLTAAARKNASTRKQGLVTHMNAIKIANGDATQAQQRNQLEPASKEDIKIGKSWA
jgi:hypothetical protein